MEVVKFTIQAIIAFFEIWLSYQVLFFMVIEKKYLKKIEKIIILFNIIVLGSMLAINRNLAFFSRYMFLACILISIICACWINKKEFLLIVGIVMLYYSSVSLADFFFAFGSIVFLKEGFYQAVYIDSTSVWQELIFLCSRVCIAVGVHFLQKKKEIRESIIEFRYFLIVVSFVFGIVLWQYQYQLDAIAKGISSKSGINISFSLIVTITIIIFVTCILLNNSKIRRENEFLLQIDAMSEQYYKESANLLQKNHQLVHDIKNHFIVIRKYAEIEKNKELCQYLEEISSDLFKESIHTWSGNKILDLLLNQKKNIAEYKKIDFHIMTDLFKIFPFSDSELCSLFGNLLDNAIEACENIKDGDKWIEVKVNRKNQLLFIEVLNSIDKDPVIKNGKLISSKCNNSMHGYGMKNIERIVEKYEGTISYQIEEKRFQMCITFFDMEVPL